MDEDIAREILRMDQSIIELLNMNIQNLGKDIRGDIRETRHDIKNDLASIKLEMYREVDSVKKSVQENTVAIQGNTKKISRLNDYKIRQAAFMACIGGLAFLVLEVARAFVK